MDMKWTDNPTKTGYYWCQMPNASPDVVWIHEGRVLSCFHQPARGFNTVEEDMRWSGGKMRYLGPLAWPDLPYKTIEQPDNQK